MAATSLRIAQAMAAYERLRADPEEWAGYLAELDEWDVTASDGLPESSEYADE